MRRGINGGSPENRPRRRRVGDPGAAGLTEKVELARLGHFSVSLRGVTVYAAEGGLHSWSPESEGRHEKERRGGGRDGKARKKPEKKSHRRVVETVEFAVPAVVGREVRRGPIRARRGEIQAAAGVMFCKT